MNDCIEIQWTAGSIDEARKVCRYLVQERLVACAQIIPWIESIYSWNNQIETTQETKIILKTLKIHFEKIEEVILKNSSYQVPEITYHLIEHVNAAYLEWFHSVL